MDASQASRLQLWQDTKNPENINFLYLDILKSSIWKSYIKYQFYPNVMIASNKMWTWERLK